VRWLLGLVVAVVATAGGYGVSAIASADEADVLGPGIVTVTIDVEHSRFDVEDLTVARGTVVRFVLVNHDPINHELVVGNDAVHARHATGTERFHPPIPGEVSVGPGETGLTFYEFDEVGTFDFVCHLPRHAEYGMVGTVTVVD
jgi:uncharacterized cupredoxin-like copper-binding protein